jgi:hypothetical protein
VAEALTSADLGIAALPKSLQDFFTVPSQLFLLSIPAVLQFCNPQVTQQWHSVCSIVPV